MIRSFRGKAPNIHPTAFISEASYIVGDVEIGENSNIWPGVVIRCEGGRVVMGKNVCVQDNAVIHGGDMYIGDNVAFGHGVMSHVERIEGNVLIGNGAVLGNWVSIGEHCLIAAGSIVVEGTTIPAYSLVRGVPAKVVGPVTEKHLEVIRGVWEPYVRLGRAYKREGLEEPRDGDG